MYVCMYIYKKYICMYVCMYVCRVDRKTLASDRFS